MHAGARLAVPGALLVPVVAAAAVNRLR
jgi:hypothetical protein